MNFHILAMIAILAGLNASVPSAWAMDEEFYLTRVESAVAARRLDTGRGKGPYQRLELTEGRGEIPALFEEKVRELETDGIRRQYRVRPDLFKLEMDGKQVFVVHKRLWPGSGALEDALGMLEEIFIFDAEGKLLSKSGLAPKGKTHWIREASRKPMLYLPNPHLPAVRQIGLQKLMMRKVAGGLGALGSVGMITGAWGAITDPSVSHAEFKADVERFRDSETSTPASNASAGGTLK